MITLINFKRKRLNKYSNGKEYQEFYNNLVYSISLHQLECPDCNRSGFMDFHCSYTRSIKIPTRKFPMKIQRVICNHCGRTHALIPDFIVPYSQVLLEDQLSVISEYHTHKPNYQSIMENNPMIDLPNIKYIINMYLLYWKEKFQSSSISLHDKKLSSQCIKYYKQQFMQIKKTINHQYLITT